MAGIFVDDFSLSSPVETVGCLGGTVVIFMMLGEGLPIHGIDFFEGFPLPTLAVAANFELANSLQVPLGGLKIFSLVTSGLDPMLCLILILLYLDLNTKRGMESTSQAYLHFSQQKPYYYGLKGYQFGIKRFETLLEIRTDLMCQNHQAYH